MGEFGGLNNPGVAASIAESKATYLRFKESQVLLGPDSLHIIYPDYARGMIRKQFADNPEGQHIRERMWNKVEATQDRVSRYAGPDVIFGLGGFMDNIRRISPQADDEFSPEKGEGLGAHLKEIKIFSQKLFLTEDGKSRFPGMLTDRQAFLLANVVAPIHDLAKYFDPTDRGQIIPDHEAIIAALVRNTFVGKHIPLYADGKTLIILTQEDVEFIEGVVGDHENIYKEEGRRNFASSPSAIERAKALFFIADTMTGVLQERDGIFYIDKDMLGERFGNLMERHLDGVKEHRPEWVLSTVEDLLATLDILQTQESHPLLLGSDENDKSVRQQILESAISAFGKVRTGQGELHPEVNEADYRQTLDDYHARLNDMLAQEERLSQKSKQIVSILEPQIPGKMNAIFQQMFAYYRQSLRQINGPLDSVPALIEVERSLTLEKMLPKVFAAMGIQGLRFEQISAILEKANYQDAEFIVAKQQGKPVHKNGNLSILETNIANIAVMLAQSLWLVEGHAGANVYRSQRQDDIGTEAKENLNLTTEIDEFKSWREELKSPPERSFEIKRRLLPPESNEEGFDGGIGDFGSMDDAWRDRAADFTKVLIDAKYGEGYFDSHKTDILFDPRVKGRHWTPEDGVKEARALFNKVVVRDVLMGEKPSVGSAAEAGIIALIGTIKQRRTLAHVGKIQDLDNLPPKLQENYKRARALFMADAKWVAQKVPGGLYMIFEDEEFEHMIRESVEFRDEMIELLKNPVVINNELPQPKIKPKRQIVISGSSKDPKDSSYEGMKGPDVISRSDVLSHLNAKGYQNGQQYYDTKIDRTSDGESPTNPWGIREWSIDFYADIELPLKDESLANLVLVNDATSFGAVKDVGLAIFRAAINGTYAVISLPEHKDAEGKIIKDDYTRARTLILTQFERLAKEIPWIDHYVRFVRSADEANMTIDAIMDANKTG